MERGLAQQARWWSWRRQRLDRSCRGVEDCLQSVVGVYSANPHGPLSLLARVPRLLKGAAVEGVIGTRRALRVPAMRRSVFMLPTETAPLAFWATRGSDAPFRSLLKRAGIDDEAYAHVKAGVLTVAQSPMPIGTIREQLADPPEHLGYALQFMCAEGELLRIKAPTIRSNEFSYCATEAWLGAPFKQVPRDEALTWLAGDYLSAFGPVSVEDFAWWTGAPTGVAEAAILGHDPIDLGGGYLLHRRDERAFAGLRPLSGRVNLLPKWDCYTMGYATASRARFAAPELLDLIFDAGGNAQPVVLVEGEVQGMWDYRISGDRIRITLRMFSTPGPRLREALGSEAVLVADFLETERRTIDVEQLERPRKRGAVRRAPSRKTAPRTSATSRTAARSGKAAPRKAATKKVASKKPARRKPAKKKPAKRKAATKKSVATARARKRTASGRSAPSLRRTSKRRGR